MRGAFLKLKSKDASASFASAICIFVSIALIFTGVKLYQIDSKSASAQESADASSLAAEGEVAKFYTIANSADTAILAMNTTEVALYASCVIAACAGNAALAAELSSNAVKVGDARTKFATQAKKSLNLYQKALPAISASKAYIMGEKNESSGTDVNAIAILVPQDGVELSVDTKALDAAGDGANDKASRASEMADELKKLEDELSEVDSQAYFYDCGANPGYCLYERASNLSSIEDLDNPFYESADAWDFDVSFLRSKAYFQCRINDEDTTSFADVRERSRSYLRRDYYSWILSKINECYLKGKGDDDLFEWPEIYHNAAGFRESERYGEAIYPITYEGNKQVMHSNAELPCAKGMVGFGSCAEYDEEGLEECQSCKFSSNNVGNIGSATTNTTSGFEHYFQAIKELKKRHDEIQKKYDEIYQKTKEAVDEVNNSLIDLLNAAKRARISPQPPGRDGAISILIAENNEDETMINNSFINSNLKLGKSAAVSGSKLELDKNESGFNLVVERLLSLTSTSGVESQVWRGVLEKFSGKKKSYSSIFDRASQSTKGSTKNKIGKYTKELFTKTLDSFGLSPSDLSSYKPVITNTSNVVKNDDGKFSTAYKKVQESVNKLSSGSTNLFSSIEDLSLDAVDSIFKDSRFVIADVELPIIGEIDVQIDVGDEIKSIIDEKISQAFDFIRNTNASSINLRSWE